MRGLSLFRGAGIISYVIVNNITKIVHQSENKCNDYYGAKKDLLEALKINPNNRLANPTIEEIE